MNNKKAIGITAALVIFFAPYFFQANTTIMFATAILAGGLVAGATTPTSKTKQVHGTKTSLSPTQPFFQRQKRKARKDPVSKS